MIINAPVRTIVSRGVLQIRHQVILNRVTVYVWDAEILKIESFDLLNVLYQEMHEGNT